MIFDDEMREQVEERVEAQFPDWKSDDQRWDTLRDLLAAEPALQREQAIHHMVLIEMMSRLYPGLNQKSWSKFGWNQVLGGTLSADEFVHRVRLAKAAGSATGKL